MARPKKQTIEYFPHYVNHHKTMFVLESKFGNDGYAFWFKLLEVLGSTNGMVYDCNNVADWEFLLAKTHLNSETASNILNILADLDAIDRELWYQDKVIWSQNLVDNVRDAFKRRISEMPQKPLLHTETSDNNDLCIQKPSTIDDSADKNGESKVKESKVKESKTKEIENKITAADYLNFFNNNFHLITAFEKQKLQSFEDDGMEAEVILMALQESVNANVRDMRYVNKILSTWLDKNINTVEAVKADKIEYERNRAKGSNKSVSTKKDNFNNYQQRNDCLDQYKQLEQQAMEELSGEEVDGQALLDEIRNRGAG